MSHQFTKVLSAIFALFGASAGWAFPPAPYFTLYGTVRDQVGQTVAVDGAQLIILKGEVEIGRAPIDPNLATDRNYKLSVRVDQNRAGTTLYTEKALPADAGFSLVVFMNGKKFYPIEISQNLYIGKGAESVRLDLNLGEDGDNDGLPDVWEQWQLYQAGLLPDENGDWAIELLKKDGDFDKDGHSDLSEYLAGTFAGDSTEYFELKIKEKQSGVIRFEFYGVTGKTYSMEHSADSNTWEGISFSVGSAEVKSSSVYRAPGVGVVSAFIASSDSNDRKFFRLTVR